MPGQSRDSPGTVPGQSGHNPVKILFMRSLVYWVFWPNGIGFGQSAPLIKGEALHHLQQAGMGCQRRARGPFSCLADATA